MNSGAEIGKISATCQSFNLRLLGHIAVITLIAIETSFGRACACLCARLCARVSVTALSRRGVG